MNKHLTCLALVFLFFTATISGQSRIELIHADRSRGLITESGDEVSILEGRVHVRQDTADIYCDRGTHYKARDQMVLSGNVRIVRGVEELVADQVTYYSRQELAISERNVRLTRPGRRMYAQYLKYYYDTDQSFARTDVVLIDDEKRVTVSADEGEYQPQRNRAAVKTNAHFVQVSENGRDTLHIYSESMEYRFSPTRIAVAVDSVRIFRGELHATCDSAVYLLDVEKVILEGNPMALQLGNELTGEQIQLVLDGTEVDKIIVTGQALATSIEDSVTDKINRLSGRMIVGLVDQQAIRALSAISNARSLYYISDQGVRQGVNSASADTILIQFDAGAVQTIDVRGGSQGTYYPPEFAGKIKIEE